jgi:hypothetical protein
VFGLLSPGPSGRNSAQYRHATLAYERAAEPCAAQYCGAGGPTSTAAAAPLHPGRAHDAVIEKTLQPFVLPAPAQRRRTRGSAASHTGASACGSPTLPTASVASALPDLPSRNLPNIVPCAPMVPKLGISLFLHQLMERKGEQAFVTYALIFF